MRGGCAPAARGGTGRRGRGGAAPARQRERGGDPAGRGPRARPRDHEGVGDVGVQRVVGLGEAHGVGLGRRAVQPGDRVAARPFQGEGRRAVCGGDQQRRRRGGGDAQRRAEARDVVGAQDGGARQWLGGDQVDLARGLPRPGDRQGGRRLAGPAEAEQARRARRVDDHGRGRRGALRGVLHHNRRQSRLHQPAQVGRRDVVPGGADLQLQREGDEYGDDDAPPPRAAGQHRGPGRGDRDRGQRDREVAPGHRPHPAEGPLDDGDHGQEPQRERRGQPQHRGRAGPAAQERGGDPGGDHGAQRRQQHLRARADADLEQLLAEQLAGDVARVVADRVGAQGPRGPQDRPEDAVEALDDPDGRVHPALPQQPGDDRQEGRGPGDQRPAHQVGDPAAVGADQRQGAQQQRRGDDHEGQLVEQPRSGRQAGQQRGRHRRALADGQRDAQQRREPQRPGQGVVGDARPAGVERLPGDQQGRRQVPGGDQPREQRPGQEGGQRDRRGDEQQRDQAQREQALGHRRVAGQPGHRREQRVVQRALPGLVLLGERPPRRVVGRGGHRGGRLAPGRAGLGRGRDLGGHAVLEQHGDALAGRQGLHVGVVGRLVQVPQVQHRRPVPAAEEGDEDQRADQREVHPCRARHRVGSSHRPGA